MKTLFGVQINKSAVALLFLAFWVLWGCVSKETTMPLPDKITVKQNGEVSVLDKANPFYKRAVNEALKTLSFALLYRKVEVFKKEDIVSLYNSSINAFHLRYKNLSRMKIFRAAGYSENVSFFEIYIIKNPVARYIFFVTQAEVKMRPFIPVVDAGELR
jgi:hypothetical protein